MNVGQRKADAMFWGLKADGERYTSRGARFYLGKSGIKYTKLLQSSERLFHMSSENCAKGKRLFQELEIMQALAHGKIIT